MTFRAKLPRMLNTYSDLYNPHGAKYYKYFTFATLSFGFMLFRSAMIRSVSSMPDGQYFDPANEYSPKVIKFD